MCTLWHRFCRKFWLLIDEIALLTDMHGETDNICVSCCAESFRLHRYCVCSIYVCCTRICFLLPSIEDGEIKP